MSGLELLLNIGGGVALLLWATRMIRTGVMRAYGAEVRRGLGRSTKNPLAALGMGVGIAALLQSSTATALLAVSFSGRRLIGIASGLALMLGADIGSTLVVQVLSFDVSWLSPVFILAGVTAFLSTGGQHWRHLGRVMIGLGLMLLSLTLIVGASVPLRESEALAVVVEPLANDPIFAVLLAALITWLAHSSVAMVLLFMSLTATGVITHHARPRTGSGGQRRCRHRAYDADLFRESAGTSHSLRKPAVPGTRRIRRAAFSSP